MTDDIVAFIRARLDEDGRLAIKAHAATENAQGVAEWYRSSTDGIGVTDTNNMILTDGRGFLDEHISNHVVAHQPSRVLRGVEAKRRILAMWTTWLDGYTGDEWRSSDHALDTLRLLASEWSTHPGYRQDWSA